LAQDYENNLKILQENDKAEGKIFPVILFLLFQVTSWTKGAAEINDN